MNRLAIVAISVFIVSGCAQQPLYHWGNYSQSLIAYAKNPGETQQFSDKLRKSIDAAEKKGRVPPGLYAELGYALVELGQDKEAIVWFSKERDRWPESTKLMSRLIERLSAGSTGTDAAPASAPTTAPK